MILGPDRFEQPVVIPNTRAATVKRITFERMVFPSSLECLPRRRGEFEPERNACAEKGRSRPPDRPARVRPSNSVIIPKRLATLGSRQGGEGRVVDIVAQEPDGGVQEHK